MVELMDMAKEMKKELEQEEDDLYGLIDKTSTEDEKQSIYLNCIAIDLKNIKYLLKALTKR